MASRRALASMGFFLVGLGISAPSHARNGAIIVGVSPYNIGCPAPNLPNADVNAAGFVSSLKFGNVTNPTLPPYSGFSAYFDNVADWMFMDPDLGALGFGDWT